MKKKENKKRNNIIKDNKIIVPTYQFPGQSEYAKPFDLDDIKNGFQKNKRK